MCSILANANVRMPLLFSDGMVLQRNKEIPVWGWAESNEKVEVHFNKQTQTIQADKNGKWMITLSAEKAGGPFELSITGKNKIIIKINKAVISSMKRLQLLGTQFCDYKLNKDKVVLFTCFDPSKILSRNVNTVR